MNRWLVAVVVLAACGSKTESTPGPGSGSAAAAQPGGPTIPAAFADFRGPIVTQGAVFLDQQRQLIRPPQLVTDRAGFVDTIKHQNITGGVGLAFTPDASAQSVLGAMRALIEAGHSEVSLATIVDGKPKVVCDSKQFTPTIAPADRVNLSISIAADARVIGISRINELDTLKPPYADFATKLKEQKESSFFSDREDVELAVASTIQGAELADVLTALCAEFHGIEPRDVTDLSINAPPDPSDAPDGGSAATNRTGQYGTIGHGDGTGSGYGKGNGSGGIVSGDSRGGGVPTIGISQPPNVVGELDKAIVRRYIKRHLNELSYCYEKQLQANPTLSGTVSAQFSIGPDGLVLTATASGVDPEVARCFADVIHAIEFSKPKSGTVQVSYPFQLRPAGG